VRARLALALLSFYLGIQVFYTFLVTPALFKLLGTETAGKVVARIFPVYFGLGALTGLLAFLLSRSKLARFCSFVLFAVMSAEAFYLEPLMSRLKLENYELFLKYHGLSAALNLAAMAAAFTAAAYLVLKGEE